VPSTRFRPLTRIVASVAGAILGVAAITTVEADAASAAPGGTTMVVANSLAQLTVTVHTRPFGGAFTVSGSLAPVASSADCVSDSAYLGWKVESTSGGFNTTNAGDVKLFSVDFADLPAAGTVYVRAQGGCSGPDGLHPNLELTIPIIPADLVDYGFNWITGTAYLGDYPAPEATSYQPAAGVVVDLMDASAGAADSPVATTVTGSDGGYLLQGPVSTQADANRSYKLRFTYPDSTVVYYDGGTMSAWQSSTTDWASASDAGGPTSWAFTNGGHDSMLSTVPAPASTNTARLCNAAQSQQLAGFDTSAVSWEGICETDPTFWGAELPPSGMTAAFARFGSVWFDQAAGAYTVTADDFTTDTTGGVVTTTLHDHDIYLADQDVTVEVTITRVFQGSDVRWAIEVRDAATGDLVGVPFSLGGAFQNDLRTTWTSVDYPETVWVSDGGARRASDEREAIVAHRAVAGSASVHTDLENIQVDVSTGGRLDYFLSVLDYTGCAVGAARTAAGVVAENLPSTFGQTRAPLAGDVCVDTWPAPSLDPMRVGEFFDQTLQVGTTDLGFSGGGAVWLEDLPAGLQFEGIHEYTPGTVPSYRIFGTPTVAGPYDISAFTMNSVYRQDSTHLTGTVLTPPQTASVALNIAIGDQVDGAAADVDGTGLAPGSTYSVVVESTPQTVGGGTIGATYLLDDTVTMPTGLEAGWHTISLAGTFADGAPAAATLWFRLAADGTLLAVSPTAPAADPVVPAAPGPSGALASTGTDASSGLTLAQLLLVAGVAASMLRRRRSA
jgi:hypothetical protein